LATGRLGSRTRLVAHLVQILSKKMTGNGLAVGGFTCRASIVLIHAVPIDAPEFAREVEEAGSAWPLRSRERCDTKPVIGTEAGSGADGDEEREGDLTRGHVRRQVRVQPQADEDAGVRDDEQKARVDLGHELAEHRTDEELRENRRRGWRPFLC
jgi:hypothetical protein